MVYRLCLTLGHRKYVSGDDLPWPCPKVMAVVPINKNLLASGLQDKARTTGPITTKWVATFTFVIHITGLDFEGILIAFFFLNFGFVYTRPNTLLAIFCECLFWLTWNKKEEHRLDNCVTLTFDFTHDLGLGCHFFKQLYLRNCWILCWICDLALWLHWWF